MARPTPADLERHRGARVDDLIGPGLRLLFVGINPGVRSALTGHHFAGFSNRFWKVLYRSGLVPEPLTYLDDDRLPEWGFGITNIVARPTRGIDELRPEEYSAGRLRLRVRCRGGCDRRWDLDVSVQRPRARARRRKQ